jgi:hypothetical protein
VEFQAGPIPEWRHCEHVLELSKTPADHHRKYYRDIRTGSPASLSTVCVTPPKTHSLRRE